MSDIEEEEEEFICLDADEDLEYNNDVNGCKEEATENDLVEDQIEDLLDENCLLHPSTEKYFQDLEITGSPEVLETEIIKMPTYEKLDIEIKQSQNRRLIKLKAITFSDLITEDMYDYLSDPTLLHIDFSFDRSIVEAEPLKGFAKFIYNSRTAASDAEKRLKNYFNDEIVELMSLSDSEAKIYTSTAQPISGTWADSLLIIKNVGEGPNIDLCKELFPDSEIIVHKETFNERLKGQILVICESKEKADEYLESCHKEKLKINDKLVIVQKWTKNLIAPKEFLRLSDRLFVLEQIVAAKELIKKNGEKEWLTNRVLWFSDLIRKDNKLRYSLNISTPALDELKGIKSLRRYTASEADKFIITVLADYKKKQIEQVKKNSASNSLEKKKTVTSWDSKQSYEKPWKGSYNSNNFQRSPRFTAPKRAYGDNQGLLGTAPTAKYPRKLNLSDPYFDYADNEVPRNRMNYARTNMNFGSRGEHNEWRTYTARPPRSNNYGRNNQAYGTGQYNSDSSRYIESFEDVKPAKMSRFSEIEPQLTPMAVQSPTTAKANNDPVAMLFNLSKLIADRLNKEQAV